MVIHGQLTGERMVVVGQLARDLQEDPLRKSKKNDIQCHEHISACLG